MPSKVEAFEPILDELQERMASQAARNDTRPFVTLTFAQSLDGSIAAKQGGEPLRLSSEDSMRMTHRLRATHDGILVGIGTVISDNPSLTTRLCEGSSPRPVILDSQLRCPPSAKFIQLRQGKPNEAPIIIYNTTKRPKDGADTGILQRKEALEAAGVIVVDVGQVGNLEEVLILLRRTHGIRHVMVEGGAQVIRWFLLSALHMVDAIVITVAPMLVGGLVPTNPWTHERPHLRLKIQTTTLVQGDIVLLATIEGETS